MGGTHFLQTGYLLLNRNAPLFYIMLGFVEMIKKISGNSIAYDTVRKKAQKRSENNFLGIYRLTIYIVCRKPI